MTDQWTDILDAMRRLECDEMDIRLITTWLEKHDPEQVEKLRQYIRVKGERLTEADIYRKKAQINGVIESYIPPNMFIRYIGEETDEFTPGAFYVVYTSYDNDRWFAVNNDKREGVICPAEWFEMMDVGEMLYTGFEEEDGSVQVTDGFVIGEKYPVYGFKRGMYQCGDGRECLFVECEPTAFVPARPVEVRPFRYPDEALHHVRNAMEFGKTSLMEDRLMPECEYISQNAGIDYHDAKTIIDHVRTVAAKQLEQGIFLDCAFATVTGSEVNNRFAVGERCIAVFTADGLECVVFVTRTENMISGIYVLTEPYELELDLI